MESRLDDAYRVVLEAHGWGELQQQLNTMTKRGEWEAMTTLITDEIVDEFVVHGTPEEIGPRVLDRYGAMVQRVSFDTPTGLDPDRIARVLASFDASRRGVA